MQDAVARFGPLLLLATPSAAAQGALYQFHGGPDQVAIAGDIDADGTADFLLADEPAPTFSAEGRIEVRSGASGTLLHMLGLTFRDGTAVRLAGLGDVDQDGRGDFACSAPLGAYATQGQAPSWVRAFSGRSGEPLYEVLDTDAARVLGSGLAGGEDLDGDGAPELVVITIFPPL